MNPVYVVFVLIALGLPSEAAAYLDPGTGSLILQSVIAVVAASAAAVSIYWRRIKAFFSRSKDEPPADATMPSEKTDNN